MTQASQPENQPKDAVFRNFTVQQASNYAEGRIGYSEKLIDFILKEHNSTGGSNGTVLDVGCGPGPATRLLAPHFDMVYGADPGESMIQTAKELNGTSRSGDPIMYEVTGAESIDKIDGLEHSSVDLITAATAVCIFEHEQSSSLTSIQAHWFDMPQFWKAAANLLKPGGTVAIWTVFRNSGMCA
jgi:2-polyprenyl-3-methyl-5-hydroxy-6-metoxy-1,4-benzoquinol methylase